MNYVQFTKAAAKITKTSSKSRPVLTGVNHTEDYVCATDSHRLLYVTGIYDGAPKVEDITTGALIDGNYPDVRGLLPYEDDYRFQAELDVKSTLAALKAIKSASHAIKQGKSIDDHLIVKLNGTSISFETDAISEVQAGYSTPVITKSDGELTLTINIKYAIEMLEAFKDVEQTVTFNAISAVRPVTITAGNAIYLTLPIRVS